MNIRLPKLEAMPRWIIRALVVVALLGLGVVLGVSLLMAPPTWQQAITPDTYGAIHVDTPEVYTRERLVNDRFLQEAWLKRQLRKTDDLLDSGKFDSVDVRRINRAATVLQAAISLNADEKGKSSGSPSYTDALAKLVKEPDDSLAAAPTESFRDAREYRREIRAELMRTQLDDRHDIEGNTLYRLNFDATIAPGSNTRSSAVIRVKLQEGDKARDLHYMNLYADWNEQLQLSVDSAIEAQTDDLLRSSSPLPGLDRIAFQEFVSNMLCKRMSVVADHAGYLEPKVHEVDKMPTGEKKPIGDPCDDLAELLGFDGPRRFRSSIARYRYYYLSSLEDRKLQDYAYYVAGILVSALSKPPDILQTKLPENLRVPFCKIVKDPPGKRTRFDVSVETLGGGICHERKVNGSAPKESNDTGCEQTEEPDCWDKIAGFARSQRECDPRAKPNTGNSDEEQNGQGDVRAFAVMVGGKSESIQCPPNIRQQESLLGVMTLIEPLRKSAAPSNRNRLRSLKEDANGDPDEFVRRVLCDIIGSGSQAHTDGFCPQDSESSNERAAPNSSPPNEETAAPTQSPPKEHSPAGNPSAPSVANAADKPSASNEAPASLEPWSPKVTRAIVRRMVAEYVKAKLEGKLSSHRVVPSVERFFNASIAGCELGACTLLLAPVRRNHGMPIRRNDTETEACEELADSKGEKKKEQEQQGAGEYLPYKCSTVNDLRKTLKVNAKVFSYAVTPTDIVQRIESDSSTRMSLQAALRAAVEKGGIGFEEAFSTLQDFEEKFQLRHRMPLVIGFGDPLDQLRDPTEDPSTQVGWVVRPRLVPGASQEKQVAQHYPLAAVVSVPSWWRSLKVRVIKEWVDDDEIDIDIEKQIDRGSIDNCGEIKEPESTRKVESCEVHYVQIPGSVKEINEKLRYEVRKEPYIDWRSTTSRGEQFLEIGRSGRLILEGGRLWRSTVVTVGQQVADKIVVLPDMNGVIAEFDCVRPPPGASGRKGLGKELANYQKAQWVTVWTSEGRTSTPMVVHLEPFVPRLNEGEGQGGEGADTGGKAVDRPCYLEKSRVASAPTG